MALRLAARAKGRTSPNPLVGAVLVKQNAIIGQGYHRRAGGDHAEVEALKQAGARAKGADLYVNLEPCNHVGRTGPCARGIVEAQIRRVIIGLRDPNPLVDGRGISALRRAGVEVVTGVLEQECRRLNEAFLLSILERRPFVTLKIAATLDGRVATRGGDSRWVTGEPARLEGHRLRNWSDAILVGVGTILMDNARLTCRGIHNSRDPLRVILVSKLRTPPRANVIQAIEGSGRPTWIMTTPLAPKTRERELTSAGARVIRVPSTHGRVDLSSALKVLHQAEVMSLLLEGGPTLAGSFWKAGLVDRLTLFLAAKLLADPNARPMLEGPRVDAMAKATSLCDVAIRRVGEDIQITGRLRP
jgi:diaminohydroxyphosphoribosylaminopyrimidine deaminase / 5-amino-6-(5-phosphoribosylamino)uracil reductase